MLKTKLTRNFRKKIITSKRCPITSFQHIICKINVNSFNSLLVTDQGTNKVMKKYMVNVLYSLITVTHCFIVIFPGTNIPHPNTIRKLVIDTRDQV